jgi:hypothetical protein
MTDKPPVIEQSWQHWNELIPGDWCSVTRIARYGSSIGNHVRAKPGVYRLVGLNEDEDKIVPAHINRICGVDTTGTLYLGCGSKLRIRLQQLSRALRMGSHHYIFAHDIAKEFRYNARLSARFPLKRLGITWLYDWAYDAVETNLLFHYRDSFGETPPLNRMRGEMPVTIREEDGTERSY